MEKYNFNLGDKNIVFYLSKAIDINKPIIFVMHGHGFNKKPTSFRNDNWNVVFPVDDFGYEGKGSWFLGEEGNYFWLNAIPLILKKVREICGKGALFFWGSSMGGYASILHGYKLNAKAVYANVPQTFLLGSKYSDNGMEKYFNKIFSNENCVYNDLKKTILKRSRVKFFLCFNQLEGSDYFSEQGLSFIRHLHSFKQPMYIEVRPQSSHGKNHRMSEVISLFEKYC